MTCVAIVAAYFTAGAAWDYLAFELQVGSTASLAGAAAVGGFTAGAITSGNIKGALEGAVTSAAFYGAGSLVGATDSVGRVAESIVSHAVVGCASSAMSGGKCGPGALSAAFADAVTLAPGMENINSQASTGNSNALIEGTVIAAVSGGTASILGGGKFVNGAETGAFGYLFNITLHPNFENGNDAHETLQTFEKQYGIDAEIVIYDFEGNVLGRADLVNLQVYPDTLWEIKSNRWYEILAGNRQLNDYTTDTLFVKGGDLPRLSIGSSIELSNVNGGPNSFVYYNLGGGLVTYETIRPPNVFERIVQQIIDGLKNMPPLFAPPTLPGSQPRHR